MRDERDSTLREVMAAVRDEMPKVDRPDAREWAMGMLDYLGGLLMAAAPAPLVAQPEAPKVRCGSPCVTGGCQRGRGHDGGCCAYDIDDAMAATASLPATGEMPSARDVANAALDAIVTNSDYCECAGLVNATVLDVVTAAVEARDKQHTTRLASAVRDERTRILTQLRGELDHVSKEVWEAIAANLETP